MILSNAKKKRNVTDVAVKSTVFPGLPFKCLLDLTFHCGLNCYTKLHGGQTSVFLSCPDISCLLRVG